jgi:bifunctional non-homologous end joining protein LigD
VVVNGQQVHLTNLSKLYWKKEAFTKGDMIRYYAEVMPFIFPYLKNRPQSLRRHPNGVGGASFYQKDVTGKVPDWIPTHEDFSESSGRPVHYLVCHHEATLMYMANLGCIELHPWHSRVDKIENPDYCLLDLDPHTGSSFEQVIETALVVKKILDAAGADCYCKTSGSSGLHVFIPLGAQYTYDVSRSFAELVVNRVQQELPEITSLERNPAKRKKKIYLDWLQNTLTQTAAGAYSLRPKPGMPVSTPLRWEEVKKGLTPTTWNARNIMERLKTEGDLFAPVLGKGIDLEAVAEKLREG